MAKQNQKKATESKKDTVDSTHFHPEQSNFSVASKSFLQK